MAYGMGFSQPLTRYAAAVGTGVAVAYVAKSSIGTSLSNSLGHQDSGLIAAALASIVGLGMEYFMPGSMPNVAVGIGNAGGGLLGERLQDKFTKTPIHAMVVHAPAFMPQYRGAVMDADNGRYTIVG